VLQIVLLVFAISILVNTVAGIDLAEFLDELRDASWFLVGLGFLIAQTPRFTQTVSTLGASPRPLPIGPVYLLQLAQTYIGLAVPTSAARIAMSVRFFQKQGLAAGTALAVGGLDGFGGFVCEAFLLGGLLLFTPQSLHFDLSAPAIPEWRTILLVFVALALVVAIISIVVPGPRRQFVGWARNLIADGRNALRDLRSPRRLLLLLGGNLGTILLFVLALHTFVRALGADVSYTDLIVINISVSLLAGLLPVPGGIGVVESALTLGLVAAGVAEGPAFAAVILYRASTLYLPPVWGFFAFRALQRREYL
jgi:uncharacterized membrane protein YbhN (UPF0104 family)